MGLYAEWKKLRDNVQSASARLYYEKNENTERKYEEALEMLGQFEKENGIQLMADEADVKKMFCLRTNEEWFCQLSTEEKAEFMGDIWGRGYLAGHFEGNLEFGKKQDKAYWKAWLKQPHKPIS